MAQYMNLYQLAYYYDVALQRDITAQLDFFCEVYRQNCGRELMSLLDIACGPGYHAVAAAKRGLYAVGLDLMSEMLEYGQVHLDPPANMDWVAADMREFILPRPIDMAICIFDGIDALTHNADVVRHFQSVAANLNPGGLYLLQLTHPRDSTLANYGQFGYQGARDDISVRIDWAVNQPQFDLVSSVAHVEIELHIVEHGQETVIRDEADERLFSPQELQLLAELSGVFDIARWYGDYNINQPFDNSPGAQYMVLVMQKKSESPHRANGSSNGRKLS